MQPIVYHKNDFPVELSRRQSYFDFSVSWNDGLQKFCVRTGRCSGWRYDVTTFGAYDTFAEAFAAAEDKASELASGRNSYNDVCLLHPEDNRKALQGSWGLSKEQSRELSHPAEHLTSLIKEALALSTEDAGPELDSEVFASLERAVMESVATVGGRGAKPSLDDTLHEAETRLAQQASATAKPNRKTHHNDERGRL